MVETGGTGISAGDKTITVNPGGTVKGGDAGNGGNATGDNTNPGGNGGNGGGTGTETTHPERPIITVEQHRVEMAERR